MSLALFGVYPTSLVDKSVDTPDFFKYVFNLNQRRGENKKQKKPL